MDIGWRAAGPKGRYARPATHSRQEGYAGLPPPRRQPGSAVRNALGGLYAKWRAMIFSFQSVTDAAPLTLFAGEEAIEGLNCRFDVAVERRPLTLFAGEEAIETDAALGRDALGGRFL